MSMTDESQKEHWIGFDLGGTKMLANVFDKDFNRLSRERKKTKGFEGKDAVVSRIISTIRGTLKEAKIDASQIAGIGIGCPGPIDTASGSVVEAPNLGWENVPIKKILEDEFKMPVVVCNDVDAGVYGEYTFGAGEEANCLVGIFPGTGVGGGCVIDGKILQGRMRSCMEIGHIPITFGTMADGAGNVGTVEAVASRLSISAQLAQASYRGQAKHLNQRAGTELSEIRSSAIAESVAKDKGRPREIVENAAENLSLAIVTIIHLLSPDMIVLGGGLVEAMPELFLEVTRKSTSKRVLQSFEGTYKIKVASLGDDAAVKGAAAWAKQVLANKNS